MTSRLLATFGLVALMAGFASAQDKDKPSIEALVKEAQEVASEDLPKAISILEKALKVSPDDHNALFLLGAMSVYQGEKSEDKAERVAMFRKSTGAFAKIQKLYKNLTQNEKRFFLKSQIGEARALSIEGKPEKALATIKQAMAGGYDDVDSLEAEDDLEAVRKLADYKTLVEGLKRAKIEEAKKEVAEEIAGFKPFPFTFALKDTDDKPVSLADYKGKVTIVDVWGTWCPPCRQEIPHFVELYKTYKEKGLEIVGINCNEQGSPAEVKKKIKEFMAKTNIPYKCVVNDEKTEEKIPGFEGYPTTLFLDRTGKVRMMTVGFDPKIKVKLEAIVASLIAETPPTDESKAK